MLCMKCGKKTENEQIFCPHCLGVMDQYPVKPDIHIQLPVRAAAAAQKKQSRKRRNLTADEQLVYLRSKIRKQRAAIMLLVLALLLALGVLLLQARKLYTPEPDPVQTYSVPAYDCFT